LPTVQLKIAKTIIRLRYLALMFALIASVGRAQVGDLVNGGKVGDFLPPHTWQYLQGHPLPGRRLMVLDFWATWCAPCRESIPKLDDVAARYSNQAVEVLGITRESEADVRPFLRKVPMKYAVAIDVEGKLHRALPITAMPYSLILNGADKIVWRGSPDKISDALLNKLLTKSPD